MALDYPISNEDKGAIESTDFQKLKVLKLFGGLPVLTAVPAYTGTDGEVVLYKATGSSDYRLYAYIDSAWKKIGDIDFLTTTGALNNVVEDTTPQLGGDLDTNDKAISYKSNKVRTYAIDKTLSDNTATAVFSIETSVTNSIWVNFYYTISLTGSNKRSVFGYETVGLVCIPSTSSTSTRNQEFEKIAGDGIVLDTTGLKTVSVTDHKKITFNLGANNDVSETMAFTGYVEIIAANGTYTFTEE